MLVPIFAFALVGADLAATETVRASVGLEIRSGAESVRARRNNQVRLPSGVRLHVVPESGARVYLVYSTATEVNVLARTAVGASAYFSFPSSSAAATAEYFALPEVGPVELTVIVSEEPVSALEGQLSRQSWGAVREQLIRSSAPPVSETGENPTSIAANLRSLPPANSGRFMLRYTGHGLIVRTYAFHVSR
ncbi:MAG: hypothetical protein H7A21_13035 [Spirochaetales bacterium]|nr:hypothetical protein [Leptospiraceae bacterium]MCP5482353.1 hypothetical protein [Spirochaetales bacterium]